MGEEMLFRGYVYQTLVQGVTVLPATLLMASIFALAHLQNPNVTPFSRRERRPGGDRPVPGLSEDARPLAPVRHAFFVELLADDALRTPDERDDESGSHADTTGSSGADWITGGAFGPEGGILVTIALMACGWYILKENSLLAPEGIVTLDSVEDLLPPADGTSKGIS